MVGPALVLIVWGAIKVGASFHNQDGPKAVQGLLLAAIGVWVYLG